MPHAAWDLDISSLVPEVYAQYRPLVADVIDFFLRRLSAPRLAAILNEQQSLPGDASVAQRLTALLFHCPTLQKLGQVVARNRKLDPELRTRLQTLESTPGKACGDAVNQVIRNELGAGPDGALEIDSVALAEASVSVVVPFSWISTESSEPVAGVLKVLKPGIEEALQEELEIWTALGHFIDERCEYYSIPPLNYAESLATIRELLAKEIRLDQEQRHLAEAAEFYKDTRQIRIPTLFPFCTPRITAMERIFGAKVTDVALSDRRRRRLANILVRALVAEPVWTPQEKALFHADPHAGNLFFTDDERLAILDWSLAGYLGKVERVHMMQLLLGAVTLDAKRIAREIEALAQAPVNNTSALHAVIDKALGKLYKGGFPGFHWSQSLLDEASLSAGVQFSKELLLYRKSLLTIEGVIADISGKSSIGRVLPTSAIRQFVCELTARTFAPPGSRHFGTHISNLDLFSLYWGGPIAAAKFWTHHWQNQLTTLTDDPPEP